MIYQSGTRKHPGDIGRLQRGRVRLRRGWEVRADVFVWVDVVVVVVDVAVVLNKETHLMN